MTALANELTGDCKQLKNIEIIPSWLGRADNSLIVSRSAVFPSTIPAFSTKALCFLANFANTLAGAVASLEKAIALGPVSAFARVVKAVADAKEAGTPAPVAEEKPAEETAENAPAETAEETK